MTINILRIALTFVFCLNLTVLAQTQNSEQKQFREIYQELVEINTTDSAGDNTQAARAMAARLKAGGYTDADVQVIVPPGGPKKGNLVARLKCGGAKKPLLLLAHLDVVEAKREDWERDPFKLVEENGYFYARGASDDKSMAAAFVANMIRMKREGFMPNRDIILALTADEEIIPTQFSGVEYLLKNHRNLIDAALALNEGGSGLLDKTGKPLYHGIQAGEKVFQTFRLEVTNPGGHSARPSRDNAIYHLADGLSRLGKFDFPFKLNEVTRAYFERTATVESGQLAADMKAILHNPPDPQALARIGNLPPYNALVRTTCVATMLDAGHATNALPQRARGVVNCRIMPDESVAEVQKTLVRVMADDKISIKPDGVAVSSPAPPLSAEILDPVNKITADMWPGTPVIPTMLVAATDGRFLNNAGIPTYGISGMFRDLDGGGVHGLNERIRVKSLYDGQEFLYRLVKALGS
ncbi:MAG TPA: M20/M25/M40 family metallo-hydrolase [Burkholderiales bacterium]|nr:M20/M25/M40 family metallo-hydrolase [Burkholderiales bacterium]